MIFAENSLGDLRYKVKTKYSERQIDYIQQQQILSIVAGQIFGGGGKGSSEEEKPEIPQTAQELQLKFSKIFGARK